MKNIEKTVFFYNKVQPAESSFETYFYIFDFWTFINVHF